MSYGRTFNCELCHKLVVICSCCDHGNIYCCAECSSIARRRSVREAGRRYQNTFKGKLNHARRQSNYRARFTRVNQKVTHHTSQETASNDLLQPAENQVIRTGELRCDFCGCRCEPFVRTDYLITSALKMFATYSIRPQGP